MFLSWFWLMLLIDIFWKMEWVLMDVVREMRVKVFIVYVCGEFWG